MRRTSATGRNDGFTLLELLVVLAVLVLLTLAIPVALPRLAPAQQLRVAAESLASALRAARDEAVLSGRPAVLTPRGEPAAGAQLEDANGPVVWAPGHALDVRWQTAEGRPAASLEFYPDGSASGVAARLAIGRRSILVEVSAMTGRVGVRTP